MELVVVMVLRLGARRVVVIRMQDVLVVLLMLPSELLVALPMS
jgi:hypothetical protein